ncbi:fungal-specific transcription factor domain-containing protein [Colletotrichum navitas]|uniref:Fungal-specific transcription factor domain-containing protein n=1 Tax=Colletotrichum navitas TaxID=681940 RepID=A0AAD8V5T8_9PEZI|nr:fungal-specific transcription factor domain-containing protein [Colletotrichum navitas]KAK1593718.1 fungal-specific transcription factor domain-containing protein [Colletotrichum navitas]
MSPDAVKPRRTLAGPIFRVRTGCLTCRGRKKKCDETKPRCRGCERNKLECQWPLTGSSSGASRSAREPSVSQDKASHTARQPAARSTASPESSTGASQSPQAVRDSSLGLEPFNFASQPTSSESPAATTIASSPGPSSQPTRTIPAPPVTVTPITAAAGHHIQDAGVSYQFDTSDDASIAGLVCNEPLSFSTIEGDDLDDDETADQMLCSPLRRASDASSFMSRGMSLLGGNHDENALELLSHYLSATTISMANGSTLENPFSVQLIPLAFGSDLVLQLLLTQSAVHRAAKSLVSADRVATKYYNQSLRLFQHNISTFMGGQNGEETLILGIGALILCLVETAKGDVNGTILDHLMAAQSLILPFLSANSTLLHKSLKDFLTEYYLYTATVSMISIDARLSDQLFLSNDLLLLATELVASSYIGSLTGCWLDLILLIPSVFDMGRRMMGHAGNSDWQPSADDFILFAQLLGQIQNWQPNPTVSENVALAGYIYQKAILLYLHTALHPLSQHNDSLHSVAVQSALSGALSHLAQLDPSVRINTSLCWPITIIGSCVTDKGQQAFLHERLGHMFATIGLGNIRQTSVLLQHVWDHNEVTPADVGAGPWNVCRVMNEKQVWISFA